MSTDDLQRRDRASLLHPFTLLKQFSSGEAGVPRIITGGHGIRIHDRDGRELLDAFAGIYCNHVGYGRPEIADAIYSQALDLAYYHSFRGYSNEPAIRLAERVLAMAPGSMQRIQFGLSGSDANETQIKIVWYYNNVKGRPNKKKIISRQRGYHGSGIVTGSLTGLPSFHQHFDLPIDRVKHTVCPHWYRQAPAGMSEAQFVDYCVE